MTEMLFCETADLARQLWNDYPYECAAPYEPATSSTFDGVTGSFVWIPFEQEGFSVWLFKDREDRDKFRESYNSDYV